MTYDLLLLAHILAAMAWLGAGFTMLVLISMAGRRGDDSTTVKLLGYSTDLGLRLFVPASVATFVFGALLVADGPWTADQLWIILALAGYAATFLTGAAFAQDTVVRQSTTTTEPGAGVTVGVPGVGVHVGTPDRERTTTSTTTTGSTDCSSRTVRQENAAGSTTVRSERC